MIGILVALVLLVVYTLLNSEDKKLDVYRCSATFYVYFNRPGFTVQSSWDDFMAHNHITLWVFRPDEATSLEMKALEGQPVFSPSVTVYCRKGTHDVVGWRQG